LVALLNESVDTNDTPPSKEPQTARALARQAAEIVEVERVRQLHLPGARDEHRRRLNHAIQLGEGALFEADGDVESLARARLVLVKAHAARAKDARHGAGQISQGSQRAPTRADCEDGWQRVASIVATAEEAAGEAKRHATALDTQVGWKSAQDADAAASAARKIIEERNHAYTFHADPGFSFGEGWYLAAAALLDEVLIQIEPDMPQSAQAEHFLREAELGDCLVPYKSRPRANKHLPEIVARAFKADPHRAQRTLRTGFLGRENIPEEIAHWTQDKLNHISSQGGLKKVLLWLRYGSHHPQRNTDYEEVVSIGGLVRDAGMVPILMGDPLQGGEAPEGSVVLTHFYKDPPFQGLDMRRRQLHFFENLKEAHGLVGQIGVTTAGMDGPALMGLPTLYLTQEPNPRLGLWVGAVPGYEEVVRDGDHLSRIARRLQRWAD
jgi:hypothetical protein